MLNNGTVQMLVEKCFETELHNNGNNREKNKQHSSDMASFASLAIVGTKNSSEFEKYTQTRSEILPKPLYSRAIKW